MSSGIAAYGILMKRISSRIKLFYPLIEPASRILALSAFSFQSSAFLAYLQLKRTSMHYSLRIRHFGLVWFIDSLLVENNY